MSDDEITRLFRVRRTVIQMLGDRGYLVDEKETTRDVFITKYTEQKCLKRELLAELFSKKDNSDQIYVFYPDEQKVGVKTLKAYMTRMQSENVSKAVVVVQKSVTPFAKNSLMEVRAKFDLEVFEEEELLVNITQHCLVPKHEVLTPEQKKMLLDQHSLKDTQLPRMLKKDPIARYYGLKNGQIVKITRDSETAGKYVTYRIVV
ncbi:hypothetical protein ACHQM5_005673 [Ranunculus cassubicifolius]